MIVAGKMKHVELESEKTDGEIRPVGLGTPSSQENGSDRNKLNPLDVHLVSCNMTESLLPFHSVIITENYLL